MDTDRTCVMADEATEQGHDEVTYPPRHRVRAIALAITEEDSDLLERLAR